MIAKSTKTTKITQKITNTTGVFLDIFFVALELFVILS